MLRKKLSSRISFLRAILELLVTSCRLSRLVKALSSGPVKSLLCSWTGMDLGLFLSSFSCLRSCFVRCRFVMARGDVS